MVYCGKKHPLFDSLCKPSKVHQLETNGSSFVFEEVKCSQRALLLKAGIHFPLFPYLREGRKLQCISHKVKHLHSSFNWTVFDALTARVWCDLSSCKPVK